MGVRRGPASTQGHQFRDVPALVLAFFLPIKQ
jgi:hypothetical protein